MKYPCSSYNALLMNDIYTTLFQKCEVVLCFLYFVLRNLKKNINDKSIKEQTQHSFPSMIFLPFLSLLCLGHTHFIADKLYHVALLCVPYGLCYSTENNVSPGVLLNSVERGEGGKEGREEEGKKLV